MNIIEKLEHQSQVRKRNWAMLRMAGYRLDPFDHMWYPSNAHNVVAQYIQFDGALKRWVWSGNSEQANLCAALNSEFNHETTT